MKFLRIFMILVLFNFVFNIGVKSKNKNDDNIVYVSVNGLVCDFCARSIEKMFEKKEAVSRISVDLENMLITIFLRDNQKLNDETIIELIKDSGYDVTEVKRAK
tara:strand:- start:231 stop:542 length:312 start_codon:yes stop_codon:yes gene_type:complete